MQHDLIHIDNTLFYWKIQLNDTKEFQFEP